MSPYTVIMEKKIPLFRRVPVVRDQLRQREICGEAVPETAHPDNGGAEDVRGLTWKTPLSPPS
jgi:hypothetical protein